ncbi:MAG: cytochrome c biogenesis heme-transporting ATPase CcmA, partial [Burkholderiaceae bacterium]|nr:cytochrome c biogenesis heme-transporting ATPase CcmA [Burkholderiaceae bacterium]
GFDGLETRALACAAGYRTLFAGLDLRVAHSRWMMLTGPNGSGKSTLLRAIAGLARPVSGEIRWRGATRRADAPEWRADCLYQGHAAGWKDSLEVHENLALQAALDGSTPDARELEAALARVGLERQARLPFGRLSAGQRRRLSLARLSMSRRPLWLLDEPGTALDANGLGTLAGLLDVHLQRGGLALVATHQPLPCASPPLLLNLAEWAA